MCVSVRGVCVRECVCECACELRTFQFLHMYYRQSNAPDLCPDSLGK
jgi:hypothetical protein